MFSAILYQLISTGICDADSNESVADYLEPNKPLYCDFVCQLLAQNDGYNVDTEQEDTYCQYCRPSIA